MTDADEDPRLQKFLDLVDCDPSEVLEIPLGRARVRDELKDDGECIDPEARRESLGEKEVYFGMHRGKKLKDLPKSYVDWALRQQPTSKGFGRFQRDLRQLLGGDGTSFDAEAQDPLTQEFLQICRTTCRATGHGAGKAEKRA